MSATFQRRGALGDLTAALGVFGLGISPMLLPMLLAAVITDMWGLCAFYAVLIFTMFAAAAQQARAAALTYLAALPLRASGRTLSILPLFLVAGAVVMAAGRWHHFAPWRSVVVWGCCGWAIVVGYAFAPNRRLHIPALLALVSVAPIIAAIAYAGGSGRRAGHAAMTTTGLGWLLAPRFPHRRFLRPKPPSVTPPTPAPLSSWATQPFRPSNRAVGLVRLFRTMVPQQNDRYLWLMAVSSLCFVLVVIGTAAKRLPITTWSAMSKALIPPIGLMAAPGSLEFLAVRPLGRRRIVAAAILPWFLIALIPTITAFLCELAVGPLPGVPWHEPSTRMALVVFSYVFLSSAQSTGRRPRDQALNLLATGGGLALLIAIIWTSPTFHVLRPPPLWALGALVVATGSLWCVRTPWRRFLATS